MAKDILKEAIADAKAVREVALANAKAALEEAFTPRLQSMLSAKLSEELDEGEDKEDIEEIMHEGEETEETVDEGSFGEAEDTVDETAGMEGEGENLDEEIDLEEILNELELEEGEDSEKETVDEVKGDKEDLEEDRDFMKYCKENPYDPRCPGMQEAKDGKEEDLDEEMNPIYRADDPQKGSTKAEYVNEDKEFNLDALLEEINNLDENEDEEETNESVTAVGAGALAGIIVGGTPLFFAKAAWDMMEPEKQEEWGQRHPKLKNLMQTLGMLGKGAGDAQRHFHGGNEGLQEGEGEVASEEEMDRMEDELAKTMGENTQHEEIAELRAALEVKSTELNEVNLLNSKLLYVNRIFKANQLDERQKLRVVESLDKAECIKEAKLIYETIKDTFNVAKSKKGSVKTKTKSLKEGLGMASKPSGTTQSDVRKKSVINESTDMISRFQKLANITIKQ